jgi:hypothetical protein
MRKMFLFSLLAALLLSSSGCKKTIGGGSCNLPHNAAPAELQGGWVNGFNNFTQIRDAYNGDVLGHTWSSAKYFKFTSNGKGAEFYYLTKGLYSQSGTHVKGTIEFDEGSTAESGSFTFYACKAHYKGYGTSVVDRDATDDELQNNLTGRYYYEVQGDWLRINPGGPVTEYSSSFRRVD